MKNLQWLFNSWTNISVKNLLQLKQQGKILLTLTVLCPSHRHQVLCYFCVSEHKNRDKVHRMKFILEKLQYPLPHLIELKGNVFRAEFLFPLSYSKLFQYYFLKD